MSQWLGWRIVVALPALALFALPPALRLAPRGAGRSVRIDYAGAGLLVASGGTVVTLLQARSTGLRAPAVIGLAVALVTLIPLLAHRVSSRPDSFVPRRVVTAPGFVPAAVMGLTIFASYYAILYVAPSLLERATGWSTLGIGAVLVPAAVFSVVSAQLASRASLHRPTWVVASCLAAVSASGVLLAALFSHSVMAIVGAVALTTVGFAGAQATLIALVPHLVGGSDREVAEGLFSFALYGGSSLGSALVGGLAAVLPLPLAIAALLVLPVCGGALGVLYRPGHTPRAASD